MGKPEDAHRIGGPASVSAVARAGVSGSVKPAAGAAAPAAEKAQGGTPVAPRPAPKVQVPKAQGGSAWDPPAAPRAEDKPGFPPLGPAGAEVQTVKAPPPVTGGRSGGAPALARGGGRGGGGAGRQPEHVRAGPAAAAKAMVAAVLQAGNEANLKMWGREGVAHAALVLGVGPLEKGVPGCGRLPVCRALLVEARKRSGGPRAGFGHYLGRP